MAPSAPERVQDSRIYVDTETLQRLGAQARRLSFLPGQPARSILNGRQASKLRGRGLSFEELREYVDGDDIRTIDWKVTARTRTPHVRVYTEEKDRPTLLLVDQRMAMFFGSQVYMKSVIAAEAAALAAHIVLSQGDRLGGLIFGSGVIAEHRPQRSSRALNEILSSISKANVMLGAHGPDEETISLNYVLRAARRIARSNALILVFSDLDGADSTTEKLICSLAQANDLILFNVSDKLSHGVPENLKITVTDGGLQAHLDMAEHEPREKIDAFLKERVAPVETWARKYRFPFLPLTTDRPASDQIRQLLGHRETRR